MKKDEIVKGLFKRLNYLKKNDTNEEVVNFSELMINTISDLEIEGNKEVWSELAKIAKKNE